MSRGYDAIDFLTRINAVLYRKEPDQVPFAPYYDLVPRVVSWPIPTPAGWSW
jgi:hypothetical protein